MICGPDCVNLQGETGTEVQGPEVQPVSQVRAAAGILPEIWSVPDLLPAVGFAGRNPRRGQVQLV